MFTGPYPLLVGDSRLHCGIHYYGVRFSFSGFEWQVLELRECYRQRSFGQSCWVPSMNTAEHPSYFAHASER